VSVFDVSLVEPVNAGITVDRLSPSVDNGDPRLTADGGLLVGAVDVLGSNVNFNVFTVTISEPVSIPVTADSTSYSADESEWPDASGGILDGARDVLDGEVVAVPEVVGAVFPKRKKEIVGVGYAVLPQLEGEGRGYVGGATGRGAVILSVGAQPFPNDDEFMMLVLDEAA